MTAPFPTSHLLPQRTFFPPSGLLVSSNTVTRSRHFLLWLTCGRQTGAAWHSTQAAHARRAGEAPPSWLAHRRRATRCAYACQVSYRTLERSSSTHREAVQLCEGRLVLPISIELCGLAPARHAATARQYNRRCAQQLDTRPAGTPTGGCRAPAPCQLPLQQRRQAAAAAAAQPRLGKATPAVMGQ